MSSPRIGIQLASLRLPFRKALQVAARLGAGGVEIDARTDVRPDELSQTGLRQLRKLLSELNLQVSAISFPTRRGYDVTDDLERRVLATQAAMRLAYQVGAPVVVNRVGRVPEDRESARWKTLCDALSGLGAYGHHVGALLAARTGAESGSELARLLSALPGGTVGVDFDPGSLIVHGHSPYEAVDALGASVLHVHASDGVQDLAEGRGLRVPIGQGCADFPALLDVLDQHRYRGWFTVADCDTDDTASELGDAIQYLKSLVKS